MYKKNKALIISDAICGILMLVSILAFVLVGIFAKVWHPTWIIIVASAFVSGIVSIVVNTYVNLHKDDEEVKATDKKSEK